MTKDKSITGRSKTSTPSQHNRTGNLMLASALGFVLLANPLLTIAASPQQACASIDDSVARLACYDQVQGRSKPRPQTEQTVPTLGEAIDNEVGDTPATKTTAPSLASIWELDAEHKRGTFRLLPYRANYFLPLHYSNQPNLNPTSPAPNHSVTTALELDALEVKYQVSARFKVWQNMLGDNGDLWFGYTQQSNWQVYNSNKSVSTAFRETNYEPEVILALRTDSNVLGWHWQMLNLGFVHQSNGRELPLSRSWNRLYAQFGLEKGDFTLLLRPWVRLTERSEDDDNPDIHQYLGSGDVRLAYVRNGYVYSALGRYSFSGGHGALQLDWAFPISGALKGYVQIFSGYGESLIDYNHAQTVLGVGILLVPW